MDNYEIILDLANDKALEVRELDFKTQVRGIIKNSVIGISNELKRQEKAEVLLHEIFHFDNPIGNLIFMFYNDNFFYNWISMKEEKRIQIKIFDYFISKKDVCEKFKYCHNTFELAEELGISENLIKTYLDLNWETLKNEIEFV